MDHHFYLRTNRKSVVYKEPIRPETTAEEKNTTSNNDQEEPSSPPATYTQRRKSSYYTDDREPSTSKTSPNIITAADVERRLSQPRHSTTGILRRSSSAAAPYPYYTEDEALSRSWSRRVSLEVPLGERPSTEMLPQEEVNTPAGSIVFAPSGANSNVPDVVVGDAELAAGVHTVFRLSNFRLIWVAGDGEEIVQRNGHQMATLVWALRAAWFFVMLMGHLVTAAAAYLVFNLEALVGRTDEEILDTFVCYRKEGFGGGEMLKGVMSAEWRLWLLQTAVRLAPFYSLFLVYVCGRFCLKVKAYYRGIWLEPVAVVAPRG